MSWHNSNGKTFDKVLTILNISKQKIRNVKLINCKKMILYD